MDLSLKGLIIVLAGALIKPLVVVGVFALALAVLNERRMQKHRRPGVTYGEVTLRKDGGWKRSDLFTEAGLAYQKTAARWGVIGTISLLAAMLLAWLSVLIANGR